METISRCSAPPAPPPQQQGVLYLSSSHAASPFTHATGGDNDNTERKPYDTKTYGELLPASVVDSHGYEIRQINDDI